MKHLIIGLITGVLGGSLIGFAVGIFIYPYWFLTDVATEQLDPSAARKQVAVGEFIDVNPSDPIHWGKGGVSVFLEADNRPTVFVDMDFEVGPGPRFHVYLVDKAEVRTDDDFKSSKSIDLGRLRAFKGSQVYKAPAGIDIASYRSVVVWCKEFGVLISPATLTAASSG